MRIRTFLALACAACGGEEVKSAKPDAGPEFREVPGARAEQITRADQLVDGPVAAGKIGDYLIHNERVRFVIEGPGTASDLYVPFGGGIVAADRVRAPGEPGQTRFGEIFQSLNFRAPTAESVEIVADGKDGNEAQIRVRGKPGVFPLVESLLAAPTEDYPAEITIDYTLMPGKDYLSLRLSVKNTGAATLTINANWLGFAMARGLANFVPGRGFDVAPNSIEEVKSLAASAGYFAVVGDRISYSFLSPGEDFNPLPPFAGVMLGTFSILEIPPDQTRAYEMLVVVGNGDTGFHLGVHEEALGGLRTVAAVSGMVQDPRERPVPRARVHVEDATKPRATGYVAMVRADETGRFQVVLPPGSYNLTAVADGHAPGPTVPLDLHGATDLVVQVGGSGKILFTVLDENRKPLPAKISLAPAAGLPELPDTFGERQGAKGLWAQVFTLDGYAQVEVPAGEVTITVSRGFEYDVGRYTRTMAENDIVLDWVTLERIVDTAGWVSGDLHLHAKNSADGWDLYEDKVRSFAAEGLEVPVNTEHEYIGDYGPTVELLGAGAWMHTIVGTELTTTKVGHFNIFPLVPDLTRPNAGALVWFGRSIPEVMKEVRAMAGRPILQLNHPRAPAMDYLTSVGFDPEIFDVAPLKRGQWCVQRVWCADFDLIEVLGGDHIPEFEGALGVSHPVLTDWASFLNRGLRVVGTGNSDSHRAETKTVGYPRTYVQVGTDDPAQVTDAAVVAALRAGRVTVSAGPFLTAQIHGQDASTATILADAGSDGPYVDLRVKLQAPPWMGPMSRIEVLAAAPDEPYAWVSGKKYGARVAALVDLSGELGNTVVRYDGVIRLRPARDTWYLVRAWGERPLDPVSVGKPYAFTNPFFVDADRDGRWTPPVE